MPTVLTRIKPHHIQNIVRDRVVHDQAPGNRHDAIVCPDPCGEQRSDADACSNKAEQIQPDSHAISFIVMPFLPYGCYAEVLLGFESG